MTELAVLETRRRLVELSADFQRATLAHRLDAIEQRPRLAALASLAAFGARPGVRKFMFATALMAYRAWRNRKND